MSSSDMLLKQCCWSVSAASSAVDDQSSADTTVVMWHWWCGLYRSIELIDNMIVVMLIGVSYELKGFLMSETGDTWHAETTGVYRNQVDLLMLELMYCSFWMFNFIFECFVLS